MVSDGCLCNLTMMAIEIGPTFNGQFYDKDFFLHTTYLGAVVERRVMGAYFHPYH